MFQPENNQDIEAEMFQQRKLIRVWIILLIVVNTLLFPVAIPGDDFYEKLEASGMGSVVGFTILGFVLGLFVALLPYRKLSYGQKYFRASMLSILGIHGLFFIGLIAVFLMRLMGWIR